MGEVSYLPDNVTPKILANLVIIALGYGVKRAGLLSREDGRVLSRIVMYVTLPAVMMRAVIGTDLTWEWIALPAIFAVVSVLMCLGGLAPVRTLNLPRGDTGTFVVSLCGFMASLAYPFIEAAYGDEGVQALALCDVGNALAIFIVAYYISFHYSTGGQFSMRQILLKVVSFVPLHVLLVGLLLNIGQVQLGGWANSLVSTLAAANSPLMLLALGIYLEMNVSRSESKLLAVNMLYKYGMGFAIALFCALLLPYHGPARAAMFLMPLTPTSLSTLMYSVEQRLNPRLAAMMISVSMLISLAITTAILVGFRSAF